MDEITSTTISARVTRNDEFADTFNDPFSRKFAKTDRARAALTDDDEQKHAQFSTWAAWKTRAESLNPKLDLDRLQHFQNKHTEKSYFELSPVTLTPHAGGLSGLSKNRTIRSDPVPSHKLAPEHDPNNPTSKPRPIPGYSGHRQGQICRELVRPISANGEEEVLRQDLTLNSSAAIIAGYDFSTYAPRAWGSSTSQSFQADSARLARRPKFQFTEKAFRRSSSDFVKHGMLSLKFGKKLQRV